MALKSRWIYRLASALSMLVCSAASMAQSPTPPMRAVQARMVRTLVRSLDMVQIPAGTYQMGDMAGGGQDDERPVHAVTIKAFKIGRHEVTVGQFRQFVEASGYVTQAEQVGEPAGCYARTLSGEAGWQADRSWRSPGYPISDHYPVACISWNDAQAFVGWLSRASGKSFRLPSEAEWEYAARAGSQDLYPWGKDSAQGCLYANGRDQTPGPGGTPWGNGMACSDGHYHAAPVGQYRANRFGLTEMTGNLSEWQADCRNDSYTGAPADGSAWVSGNCDMRAVRGGDFMYTPLGLRTANRVWFEQTYRNWYIGFRIVQASPSKEPSH